MRMHFRLVDAAEGEHGNVKAAEGKDRVFILAAPGDSGHDFIAEEDGGQGKELVIRFEYRAATLTDWPEDERADKKRPPVQKDLSALAAKHVVAVAGPALAEWIVELGKPHVLANGDQADYCRLEAHLRRYTARNTFDYFIHKDLGTFLRRELDFYIKNEVMHLDDVENESAPRVEQYPIALRLTHVTPTLLTDSALPSHYAMIRKIRDMLLAWSPATFIGFNSMSFDENLLRQALFQTLHPAYLTNTNGNARSDVLRVAHAASAYTPDALVVPTDDLGRQVFRLDRLALANGHHHDGAHEAMADVVATMYVARLIRNRAPDIWKAMDRAATKNAVKTYVATESVFSLTESYYGCGYSWLVTPCGQNPRDVGQLAVFDLSFDPDDYRFLSAENLVAVLNVSPKAIRSIRANRQPIMMPADAAPDSTKALASDSAGGTPPPGGGHSGRS